MRFSFAIHLPQPLHVPVSDRLPQRPVAAPDVSRTEPQADPVRELPQDLDQRVRELGEW